MDEMVTRREAYKSYWTVLFCGDVYYAVEESLSLDVDHSPWMCQLKQKP